MTLRPPHGRKLTHRQPITVWAVLAREETPPVGETPLCWLLLTSVADQGPGIPHNELERVFERFFRGNGGAHKSGTGLGLSIARDMVELMGGTLTVRSTRGSGATFTVRMPRIQG